MRPDDDDVLSSPPAARPERPAAGRSVHGDPADPAEPANPLTQPASSGNSGGAAGAPSRRHFLKTALLASAATAGAAGAGGVLLSNGSPHLHPLRLVRSAVSGACQNPSPTAVLTFSVQPGEIVAGNPDAFTITARDAFGDISCYTGTVHFTSSDPSAILPADVTYTLGDAGSHGFSVTFNTPGTQTVTVTDTSNPVLTATSTPVTVHDGTPVALKFSGLPPGASVGAAFGFTVMALDALNNIAPTYTGTVHFTSSDPSAILPADVTYTLGDAGSHGFSATFNTPGTQTLTVTDTSNPLLTAISAPIPVTP